MPEEIKEEVKEEIHEDPKEEIKIEVKSLKIKIGLLEKFISFLDVPLHGVEARVRNRFITILGKKLIVLNQEKQKILGEHSEKDENGKTKFLEEGKKYDITPENLKIATKEIDSLYAEDCIIDILPSNEKEIAIVRNLLFDTKQEFSIVDGSAYDEICKAFESIK